MCLTRILSVSSLSFNPKLLQRSMPLEAAWLPVTLSRRFPTARDGGKAVGQEERGSHCLTQFCCSNQPRLVLTREQNEKEKKIQSTVFLKHSHKTSQTTFLSKSVTLD